MEGGRVKVARVLPVGDALLQELQAFQVKFSQRSHDRYAGACEHDDLVVAAALVAWWQSAWRQVGAPALYATVTKGGLQLAP